MTERESNSNIVPWSRPGVLNSESFAAKLTKQLTEEARKGTIHRDRDRRTNIVPLRLRRGELRLVK